MSKSRNWCNVGHKSVHKVMDSKSNGLVIQCSVRSPRVPKTKVLFMAKATKKDTEILLLFLLFKIEYLNEQDQVLAPCEK